MPRQARIRAESKTYHIIMRGINKQIIFEDDFDKNQYIEYLRKYKDECGFKLYAYCLMNNHIHLVIREGDAELSSIFKKINTSYAMHYNYRYMRCGQLFQDRFRSEPIISEAQLLNTVRYVHWNPIKAGLCESLEGYRYSSCPEYLGMPVPQICDKDFVVKICGGIKSFIEFTETDFDYKCMDLETDKNMRSLLISDEDAINLVLKIIPFYTPGIFLCMDKRERNDYISELKEKGLTNKQICRITGLGRGIVEKIRSI